MRFSLFPQLTQTTLIITTMKTYNNMTASLQLIAATRFAFLKVTKYRFLTVLVFALAAAILIPPPNTFAATAATSKAQTPKEHYLALDAKLKKLEAEYKQINLSANSLGLWANRLGTRVLPAVEYSENAETDRETIRRIREKAQGIYREKFKTMSIEMAEPLRLARLSFVQLGKSPSAHLFAIADKNMADLETAVDKICGKPFMEAVTSLEDDNKKVNDILRPLILKMERDIKANPSSEQSQQEQKVLEGLKKNFLEALKLPFKDRIVLATDATATPAPKK